MKQPSSSRRQFLVAASTALVGTALGSSSKVFGMPAIISQLGDPKSLINGVKVGVITYSFRDLKDQSAEATLQYILDSGISYVELMGGPAESFAGAPKNSLDFRTVFPLMRKRRDKVELTEEEKKILTEWDTSAKAYREEVTKWRLSASMDKFEQLRKMFNSAGVSIYAFKPDAFGVGYSEAEIMYGMRAAKALGASHVTLEHPSNDEHTLKLGKIAEKMGVNVAYHGHEQQTPIFWDTALAQSPANMLNLDFGHYVAAGNSNPIEIVQQKHERIMSMHLKDRTTPAHGKGNLMWGQGDTPIGDVLKLIRDKKYQFPVTIELEYQVPKDSTPVAEVKRCVEFCKKALS
jgi:sugar phosphate isomerase/epimerase